MMTEDEAIKMIFNKPRELPQEFRTKEFIMKLINKHGLFVDRYYFEYWSVKLDYDLILAREIRYYNIYHSSFDNLYRKYSNDLSVAEIDKLYTTLELIVG